MRVFFGFAVADSMFPGDVTITRKVIEAEKVRELVNAGVIPALNPAHESTICAMRRRFGLMVEVPAKAPMVKLDHGDKIVVMSVRGLPRREGIAEYSDAEIAGAAFEFSVWEVLP